MIKKNKLKKISKNILQTYDYENKKKNTRDLYILISLTVVPFLLTITGITVKIFNFLESGFLYGIVSLYFATSFIANCFIYIFMCFLLLQGLFGSNKDTLFSPNADIYVSVIYHICIYLMVYGIF